MVRTNIRGTQIADASVDVTVDVTGVLPLANGGTGGTDASTARTGIGLAAMATAATVSTIAQRDANGNLTAAGVLQGYTTTTTAAGTTTLTVASSYLQFFTGSTTQTVTMPVTSTLVLGQQWLIVNTSTGAVTVQSSGANAIVVVAAGTSALLTCILITGTTAASWQATYLGDVVASGKKLTVSNTLTLAGTDATTLTFQGTDTYVGRNTTDTLTLKRITPRIGTTASSSTPTPDADAHDQYNVTALAAGATFGAPTGTPTDGQKLTIRVKDNGTARTLAYNAIYRAVGVTLPTTTVISKTLYLGMVYNLADTKWDIIAFSMEA